MAKTIKISKTLFFENSRTNSRRNLTNAYNKKEKRHMNNKVSNGYVKVILKNNIIQTKNWLPLVFQKNHANKTKQKLKIINFDSMCSP